jgi:hypothetical protein
LGQTSEERVNGTLARVSGNTKATNVKRQGEEGTLALRYRDLIYGQTLTRLVTLTLPKPVAKSQPA